MTLSHRQQHDRFRLQAQWTQELRRVVYDQLNLSACQAVLDLGCGTGALLGELSQRVGGYLVGLDLSFEHLSFASTRVEQVSLTAGDAQDLPFRAGVFDAALCHFVLLWVKKPTQVLREMRRVVKPGGLVIAFAEPDYGGRIDFPPELERIQGIQLESLAAQGADPLAGRKIRQFFQEAGLDAITSGVLQGYWQGPPSEDEFQSEWTVLTRDLQGYLSPGEIDQLRLLDRNAWQEGFRTLFVPTFYAWGTA